MRAASGLRSRAGGLRGRQVAKWPVTSHGAARKRLSTDVRTNVWQDPKALENLAAFKASPKPTPDELRLLKDIEKRVNWLSALMIDNANNQRPKRDNLKVGGHQASSSSVSTVLTALYAKYLRPQDRVAVKPHAGPAYHSLMYMMGRQTRENLEKFRSFGGVQPYPSRTKDLPDVDLSTGSVGLGAAITSFTSLTEEYLRGKGLPPKAWPGTDVVPDEPGRHIAIVGDAELDEGNVFETLMETWKLGITNNWFVIDYNRQSLDKIMEEKSYRVIDKMFRTAGWDVVTLKFGKQMLRAFDKPGGHVRAPPQRTRRQHAHAAPHAPHAPPPPLAMLRRQASARPPPPVSRHA